MKKTVVINIIGGPGIGKSIITAKVFALLKELGFLTEIVLEKAKETVWKKKFKKLNNQYKTSKKQYKSFKLYNHNVNFIVTDGSLLHGLVYNKININNISNKEKTEKKIIKWFNEFDNIVFYLKRNKKIKFEQQGRIQNLKEAKKIDKLLLNELLSNEIKFNLINVNKKCYKKIVDITLLENEIKRK